MLSFFQKLLESTRRFNLFDFAIFKICLLAVGILLASYFPSFFYSIRYFVWAIAIGAYIYLLMRVFRVK